MIARTTIVGVVTLVAGAGVGAAVGASALSTSRTTTIVETYTTPARTITQKVAVVHVHTVTQAPVVRTETITVQPGDEHQEAEVHNGITTSAPDPQEEQERLERERCSSAEAKILKSRLLSRSGPGSASPSKIGR